MRIIYGPEYTAPENLERLRSRALAGKRSLAVREFALGIEGLERFVRKEPLRRVPNACLESWRLKVSRWTRGCREGIGTMCSLPFQGRVGERSDEASDKNLPGNC